MAPYLPEEHQPEVKCKQPHSEIELSSPISFQTTLTITSSFRFFNAETTVC